MLTIIQRPLNNFCQTLCFQLCGSFLLLNILDDNQNQISEITAFFVMLLLMTSLS